MQAGQSLNPKTNVWTLLPRDLKFFIIGETLIVGYDWWFNDLKVSEMPTKIGIDYGIHTIAQQLSNL